MARVSSAPGYDNAPVADDAGPSDTFGTGTAAAADAASEAAAESQGGGGRHEARPTLSAPEAGVDADAAPGTDPRDAEGDAADARSQ